MPPSNNGKMLKTCLICSPFPAMRIAFNLLNDWRCPKVAGGLPTRDPAWEKFTVTEETPGRPKSLEKFDWKMGEYMDNFKLRTLGEFMRISIASDRTRASILRSRRPTASRARAERNDVVNNSALGPFIIPILTDESVEVTQWKSGARVSMELSAIVGIFIFCNPGKRGSGCNRASCT